jgi:hypothetical protein
MTFDLSDIKSVSNKAACALVMVATVLCGPQAFATNVKQCIEERYAVNLTLEDVFTALYELDELGVMTSKEIAVPSTSTHRRLLSLNVPDGMVVDVSKAESWSWNNDPKVNLTDMIAYQSTRD